MTLSIDEIEFAALTEKIARDRGFACASYKDRCLKRRIAVRMRARDKHTYPDYAALLDADPGEYDALLDALTINVTRLFRNPEVFESISNRIVPSLLSHPDREIRVWSAGCSSGEEPWSLAMILHRASLAKGGRAAAERIRIVATDIDVASLERARIGEYGEIAFPDVPADYREQYFSPGFPARVSDDVRGMVDFRRADIFVQQQPVVRYHLIVCRNVIIYFDKLSQEKLFERFHDLLLPGGFLVLGKVETILGAARKLFEPLDVRERLFRKS